MSTPSGTSETPTVDGATEPAAAKLVQAVRLLRIGTWSVFSLGVAALLVVTVIGPFLLGNPAITGGQPVLLGGLLLSVVVGTAVFVTAALLLD